MEKLNKHMVRNRLLSGLIVVLLLSGVALAFPGNYPKKLENYRVMTSTTATTGTGISGATWNPYTNRVILIDNNAVNWKEIRPDQPTTILRTVTLSGFTDPESASFVDYDPTTNKSRYVISEEGLNRVSICGVSEAAGAAVTITRTTVGDCASSTVMQTSGGADIWTPDATNGMEGIAYKNDTNQVIVTKQRTNLEYWVCNIAAPTNCTEPFDAQAILSGTVTELNDLYWDNTTGTTVLISNASGLVIRINPVTGAIIDSRSIADLGFTQEEGMGMTPDGQHLFISSEPTSFAHLEWMGGTVGGISPFTVASNIITQTTADDQTRLDKGSETTGLPLRIINDVVGIGGGDISDTTRTRLTLEYYDSNELIGTQTNAWRVALDAVTPVGSSGVAQESGGEFELSTVLGTGTHGTNTQVLNVHAFNTGQVGVAQGAASTSRGTVWAKVGGTIFFSTTQTGNTAGAETDLHSYAMTAASLATNGDSLRCHSGGTFGAGASADKRLRAKFGGTTVIDSGALAVTSTDWDLNCEIIRTGAATQKSVCSLTTNNAGLVSSADYTTPAETLANAITYKITGAGTNANDTVGEFTKCVWQPAS